MQDNYRYLLWRVWDEALPLLGFILLNPSTANETYDDPTLRRCISFARQWEYGGLEVVNLFAYRTAYPFQLRQTHDPIGPENNLYISQTAGQVECMLLGWGNAGYWQGRGEAVINLLADQVPLKCLGKTKLNQPRHPLYISKNTLPTVYQQLHE